MRFVNILIFVTCAFWLLMSMVKPQENPLRSENVMSISSVNSFKINDLSFAENSENRDLILALEIFKEQEKLLAQDMKLLSENVKNCDLCQEAILLLQKDFEILKNLKQAPKSEILSVAISKMRDSELTDNSEIRPIFLDAISFLEKGDFTNCENLKGRNATVAKFALLYLNLKIFDVKSVDLLPFFKQIQFLYPALIGEFDELKNLSLSNETNLYIPNSGYVFGGQMFAGDVNRGIDCSSYTYFITFFSKLSKEERQEIKVNDPSTRMAAAFACLKKGEEFVEMPCADLQEKIANSPDAYLLTAFDVVPNFEQLQEGDLVVWRKFNEKSKKWSGHVAIFGEFANDKKDRFKGFEALRMDTADGEGVRAAEFPIFQNNKKTYFLRALK